MRKRTPEERIPQTGRTIGDFWAWAYSDVDTNVLRAVYAEWLVGTALGCARGIRPSWTPWDLDYGDSKIEVKSTSYRPNWGQLVDAHTLQPKKQEDPEERFRKKRRTFDIKATAASFAADPAVPLGPTADYYEDPDIERRADLYVFAYYAEQEPARYDSLDTCGWRFYVLATPEVERHFCKQQEVALSRVQAVTEEVGYEGLKARVDEALA